MTYVKSPEPRTVYLAVKTTSGYATNGEILEIAILDERGDVLLDTFVHPEWGTSWKDGVEMHGIWPTAVSDAPLLEMLCDTIRAALAGQTVVTFNAPLDRRSPGMARLLAPAAEIHCVMGEFAKALGQWDEKRGNWRWPRLSDAARHVHFALPGIPHRRALHDCQAIRAIWQYLTDPEERARVDALRADAVPST